ncbi:hypothetical protein GCK72_007064 [Caenorhabditis remanei]|uniref:Uncharacterized protein n=1 Tax=Caenorhabditis remanei TaxID=31234 RepID=A0A6A5HK92_CAERE|nr:hypothetical protein GCK72_007064 [Caenorhabditis remanei]KAF1767106.1 hypothetical protein GCK72_007064 [Caenorhabditis remanei]
MKPLWFSLLILVPYCIGQRLTREYCVKRVNGFRAELAMERQVANMNELVYNQTLEKKILEQLSIINRCPKRGMTITHDGFNIYLPVNDSSPISGTPGSQCPAGRSSGSDNLCSLGKPKVHSAYIRKGSRDILKFSDESQEKSKNQYVRKNVLGDYPDALKNGILVSYGPLPPTNKGAYMRKSGWDSQSEWKSQNEEFGGISDVWVDGGSDYSQEADNDFETTEDPLDQSVLGSRDAEKPVYTTTDSYDDDDDDDWFIVVDNDFETTEDPLEGLLDHVPGSPDVVKQVSTTTDPHNDDNDDVWFLPFEAEVDNDFETTEDPLDQTDSGSPDVEKPVFTTTTFPKNHYASHVGPLDDDFLDAAAEDYDFETTEDPLDQSASGSPAVEKPVFTTTPFPKDNYAPYIAELSAASKELFKAAEK